jgi:hypothetical protein
MAITPILKGKDTIAQAQSGTGKTGTFVISCLEKIDTKIDEVQGLVLAPTREFKEIPKNTKINRNYEYDVFWWDKNVCNLNAYTKEEVFEKAKLLKGYKSFSPLLFD